MQQAINVSGIAIVFAGDAVNGTKAYDLHGPTETPDNSGYMSYMVKQRPMREPTAPGPMKS